MNLNTIIEKLNNKEEISKIEDLVTVKSYIPILLRKNMIDYIVNRCLIVDEETGMLCVNRILQQIYTIVFAVCELTDIDNIDLFEEKEADGNIDIDINMGKAINMVDTVLENGIYDYIYTNAKVYEVINMIEDEIFQRKEIYNSIASTLSRKLDQVINMIPTENKINEVMAQLPSLLNNPKVVELAEVLKKING